MGNYGYNDNTARWLDETDYRVEIPAPRPQPQPRRQTLPSQKRQEVLPGTAAPQRREALPERALPRRTRSARRGSGRVQQTIDRAAVDRNREKLSAIGLPYLMFLALATALLMISCVNMLTVRSQVTASQNRIEKYRLQLQTVKSDNDAAEVYMNKSIDLDEIYKIATEELGMVYPSEDQVIYYNKTEKGYVRQYEDIPTD